ESIHLDEEGIERLLAFVVTATDSMPAMPSDRVDFVDENNAGRRFLALFKHVAHPARADADEHLDKVRTADGKERNVRFARDGAGEQRLACAGRADEEDTFGNASA